MRKLLIITLFNVIVAQAQPPYISDSHQNLLDASLPDGACTVYITACGLDGGVVFELITGK